MIPDIPAGVTTSLLTANSRTAVKIRNSRARAKMPGPGLGAMTHVLPSLCGSMEFMKFMNLEASKGNIRKCYFGSTSTFFVAVLVGGWG